MRIAIVSDIHLGDSRSLMAFRDPGNGKITEGRLYSEFKNAIRGKCRGEPADYLVLLGDILDFSITSYSEAYQVGRFFFQKIRDDKLAKEFIYLPGNHDFDIWNTVEYQVNITNRVIRGKTPKPFRMSLPAILDDRKKDHHRRLTLPWVRPKKTQSRTKYAGLFMDAMTDPPTPFNFGYPNLYLITPDESVIVTHGQYLDIYWSFLGRWGTRILQKDLPLQNPYRLNMKELVAMNFPLCQMESTALGQAGPLTEVVRRLQMDINEFDYTRIETYFDRLQERIEYTWKGVKGRMNRTLFNMGKKKVISALNKVQLARYNEEFVKDPRVRKRFQDFFISTLFELDYLEKHYDMNIPSPRKMIFGHTHQPIPWGSPDAPMINLPTLPSDEKFAIYNTGGWLPKIDDKGLPIFYGAEIFFYDSDEGFSSMPIGYNHGSDGKE